MNWGATSKLFHWLGAALIFYLLIHGFWMVTFPPRWEKIAAHAGHWGLYLLMLASAFSGFRVPALVSGNSLHGPMEQAHVLLSWALAILVVVHVASAFYHLWWRKDDVMQRMLR